MTSLFAELPSSLLYPFIGHKFYRSYLLVLINLFSIWVLLKNLVTVKVTGIESISFLKPFNVVFVLPANQSQCWSHVEGL